MDFTPQLLAAIGGQILDENGRPEKGVQVTVMDKYFRHGALLYAPVGRGQRTNSADTVFKRYRRTGR
jgi:hypothetical protein